MGEFWDFVITMGSYTIFLLVKQILIWTKVIKKPVPIIKENHKINWFNKITYKFIDKYPMTGLCIVTGAMMLESYLIYSYVVK